jgi:hypothetical protein
MQENKYKQYLKIAENEKQKPQFKPLPKLKPFKDELSQIRAHLEHSKKASMPQTHNIVLEYGKPKEKEK